MGYGWTIDADDNTRLAAGRGEIPPTLYPPHQRTNNTAEYYALLQAIQWLQNARHLTISSLTVCGDSQLVLKAVEGTWKAKKPHLAALRDQCQQALYDTRISDVSFEWTPREENSEADEMSTHYLGERRELEVAKETGGRIVDFSRPSPYGRYHKGFR